MCIQAVPYELTEQGIFDFVYKFIVEQGEPAIVWNNLRLDCAYRTPNKEGTKMLQCAAGCLITDDEASKLNNYNSWAMQDSIPDRLAPFRRIISTIQGAHDGAATRVAKDRSKSIDTAEFLAVFKDSMHHIARCYRLTVPE